MTFEKAKEYYNIPIEVIQEYKKWKSKGKDEEDCNDSDLEQIKMIMLLQYVTFTMEEIREYMKMYEEEDSDLKRLRFLNKKRDELLDNIHLYEKKLENLDFLRYELRKNINN